VESVNVVFEPRMGTVDGEEIKEILKEYGDDSTYANAPLQ
jgi:hypothetical protein